jgi:hypothetical protein
MSITSVRVMRPTPRKFKRKLDQILLDEKLDACDSQIVQLCNVRALERSTNAWRNWIIEMVHLYLHFLSTYAHRCYALRKTGTTEKQMCAALESARFAAQTFAEFDGMQSHLQMNDAIFEKISVAVFDWIREECNDSALIFFKDHLEIVGQRKKAPFVKNVRISEAVSKIYATVPEPRHYKKHLSNAISDLLLARGMEKTEENESDETADVAPAQPQKPHARPSSTLQMLRSMQKT